MKTLPPVALGTWSWGTGFAGGDTVFGNHLSDTQMAEVFTAAMSKGLNLWDTAAVYGMGSSETALGALVRQFPRENIILSTKFTPQIADKQSAQPVSDMLEASLGRLGVDAIDIYWIHNPLDVEKWTPGLIPLLQSGKVKRVGVSNHNLAQIRRANEILNASGYSLSAVQNHYSLLYRASEEAGILDYCRQNNITFFAYMVLEQGALSGRYDSNHPMPAGSGRAESYNAVLPQIERLTAAMKKMGAERNASVAQIAIAWAIAKGTLPLVGATKVHHVLDAACASDIQLRDEEIILLDTDAQKAWSHAVDLQDTACYAGKNTTVRSGGYEELRDADICVISYCGAIFKENRLEELEEALNIADEIIPKIQASGFQGVVVSITNPCDLVALYFAMHLELMVVGTGTALDSARFRIRTAQALGVAPADVDGFCVGEHGDSQVPVWSQVRVGGRFLEELEQEKRELFGRFNRDEIEKATIEAGWKILTGKGSTEYGIGAAAASLIQAILTDSRRVLPCSWQYKKDENGPVIYTSIPSVIGAGGVIGRIAPALSKEEAKRFDESCRLMEKYRAEYLDIRQ